MNNAGFAGALGAGLTHAERRAGGGWRHATRVVWGLACGASFVVGRASLYLIVLPLAALACLAGAALYAIQAAAGGSHG